MATIHVFEPEDATAVAALFQRVYPDNRGAAASERTAYIREMFFDNPWRDPEIPSWVALQDGQLIGFLGVMQRPMLLGKRPIRAAVGCQFLVDPEKRRGLAAVQLLRSYLRGPQDLSLADGANQTSRKLWEATGGFASPLHSLAWIRVLRPAQSALRLAGSQRRWFQPIAALGTPFAALADACLTRTAPFCFKPRLCEQEDLDARALLAALGEYTGGLALRPHYDLATLEWLLAQVTAKKRHGRIQARLVRDPDGRVAGWFLYYLNPGMSRVVQLAARTDRVRVVLEHLFQHASERGTLALEGRMDPRFASELGAMHCFFHAGGESTLLHARDPSVVAPLLRDDAFFTRMEGEWWLRFHGESETPSERVPLEPDKPPPALNDLAVPT